MDKNLRLALFHYAKQSPEHQSEIQKICRSLEKTPCFCGNHGDVIEAENAVVYNPEELTFKLEEYRKLLGISVRELSRRSNLGLYTVQRNLKNNVHDFRIAKLLFQAMNYKLTIAITEEKK